MSISQEQPPVDTEVNLREFLTRRFVDVGVALEQSSKFPARRGMPQKPQFGDVHYFGDPATHQYDPVITGEGWWGFVEVVPNTDPKTGYWTSLKFPFDGFNANCRHDEYIGDLNDINCNSIYNIRFDVANTPPDFVSNFGFVHTMMYHLDDTHGTQVIYGMEGANQWKYWQRTKSAGSWTAWKEFLSENNLAGFQSDGTQFRYIGDLNDINRDGIYTIVANEVTNEPTDFDPQANGFIHTMVFSGTPTFSTQVIYGMNLTNSWRYWQRSNIGGTWQPWKDRVQDINDLLNVIYLVSLEEAIIEKNTAQSVVNLGLITNYNSSLPVDPLANITFDAAAGTITIGADGWYTIGIYVAATGSNNSAYYGVTLDLNAGANNFFIGSIQWDNNNPGMGFNASVKRFFTTGDVFAISALATTGTLDVLGASLSVDMDSLS